MFERCRESWRRWLPDYEICVWSESNLDVKASRFAREAFERRKWAFVSDYFRLEVLHKHGGIYLDTDVEVVGSFDRFIGHRAFIGFERKSVLSTAVIGAVPGSSWIDCLLGHYREIPFVRENGDLECTPNVVAVSRLTFERYGEPGCESVTELDDLALYPQEYFSPRDFKSGILKATGRTAAIHHFEGSWQDAATRSAVERRWQLSKVLGSRVGGVFDRGVARLERLLGGLHSRG